MDNCKKLQDDFVLFSNWCVANHLKINVDESAQISFTRRNKPLMYNYRIDDKAFRVVTSIKDLGIILSVTSPSQRIFHRFMAKRCVCWVLSDDNSWILMIFVA
jgi:hypothetical protein